MNPVTVRDFEKIKGLSELRAAPDGRHAVFCVTQADIQDNCYKSHLELLDVETGETRPLTVADGRGYVFADDGKSVLFPALRDPADKKAVESGEELTVFYRLPLAGGEAREAFRIEAQVKKLESLGGGKWLVSHLCDLTRPDLTGLKPGKRAQVLARWKKESEEFHVVDELPFWFDGRGFVNKKRTCLSVFSEQTGALVPLTTPAMDVGAYVLARDKKSVVFAGNDVKGWRISDEGLYSVSLPGGETETLVPLGGQSFDRLVFWQDRLVIAGSVGGEKMDMNSSKLYTYNVQSHRMELAFDPDEDLGASVTCEASMGGEPMRAVGGDILLVTGSEYRGRLSAWKPGETALRRISPETLCVLSFEQVGGRLLAVGFTGSGLQEVYDVTGGQARALTSVNQGTFDGVPVPEPLSFVNSDGVRIDGWVLKPADYQKGKKYPGILSIHGGPRGAYCETFSHEMQVLAARGYFVFFCNPRGSATRGNAFADVAARWGTIDYDDLMAFTDEVLRAYPDIDKERLGVTGGSYGGYMTNWIIGHTDRFAAAVTCRSITYLTGFSGVSDLGCWTDLHEQGGLPWKGEQQLRDRSPLFALDKVKTPTLILHSFEDHRCTSPEAYGLYQALIAHGVETRMVLFYGESHGLSRTGQPRHRVRRLEELAGWFDSHLKS